MLNQTTTKAVKGITPYEATFGKKLNLKNVHEWGEKVWVHIEKGNKLGGHVHEGRWLGIDDESKGIHVWWPDTKTVGVERNVYYDNSCSSGSHFERERNSEGFIKMPSDEPLVLSKNSSTANPPRSKEPESLSTTQTIVVPVPNPEHREKCA